MNLPNAITVARIFLVPLLVVVLLTKFEGDIASVGAMDTASGNLYFIASPSNATQRYLYAARLDGDGSVRRITPENQPGTHTYNKFIRPSELRQWAHAAGLRVVDLAGLDYDPFSRKTQLTADASVNYLMHLRRPEGA